MQRKLYPFWHDFEATVGFREGDVSLFKAVFYMGAYACAQRTKAHLKARGKYDEWMAELMFEIEDAITAIREAEAEFKPNCEERTQ